MTIKLEIPKSKNNSYSNKHVFVSIICRTAYVFLLSGHCVLVTV